VAVSEGQVWHDQRRFMLRILSDLGMGKKDSMENAIWNDAQQIVEKMKEEDGKPIQVKVGHYYKRCIKYIVISVHE